MKVFISADIEGTAGITDWDEALKTGANYMEFRELMTAELVAACEAAAEAGATEIVVKDAHQTGRNLLVSRLPEYVSIVRGWSGHPLCMMQGLDSSFDAALYVGYHAKAGADGNPLGHTMRMLVSRLSINGQDASEFTINAYAAALFGVPSVFLSGDAGVCADARDMVPNLVAVPVSTGLGPSTVSVSPVRARAMIRDGVRAALAGDPAVCRVVLPDSFSVEIRYANPGDAYRAIWYPGVEQVAPRTVRFETADFFEVLRTLQFIVLRA